MFLLIRIVLTVRVRHPIGFARAKRPALVARARRVVVRVEFGALRFEVPLNAPHAIEAARERFFNRVDLRERVGGDGRGARERGDEHGEDARHRVGRDGRASRCGVRLTVCVGALKCLFVSLFARLQSFLATTLFFRRLFRRFGFGVVVFIFVIGG